MIWRQDYILLVDGSTAAASLFSEILLGQNFPYDILIEKSGNGLISFLERRIDHLPRLIVMELYLPDVHGCECIELINSKFNCKDIHFIVFASSISAKDKERCEKLGVGLCLTKPVELSGFEMSIKQIRNYWETQVRTQNK